MFQKPVQRALLLIALWLLALPVRAQTADGCSAALAAADNHYEDGDFEAAVSSAAGCVSDTTGTVSQHTAAYRLMALSYLRVGDVTSAKEEILNLFGVAPDYEPDPVQDPPSYLSLVSLVRNQLAVPRQHTAEADSIPPSVQEDLPALRRRPLLYITAKSGSFKYGGDRGGAISSPSGVWTEQARAGLGLEGGYHVSPVFSVGGFYLLGRYPEILDASLRFDRIDRSESSEWIHMLGAVGRARAWPTGVISPYVHAGPTIAFALLNGSVRAGFGPRVGVGIEVNAAEFLGLFIEYDAVAVYPDNAVDLASTDDVDMFYNLSGGIRYHLWR